jgi:hypothetical protein
MFTNTPPTTSQERRKEKNFVELCVLCGAIENAHANTHKINHNS